jgi:hypothetical protein
MATAVSHAAGLPTHGETWWRGTCFIPVGVMAMPFALSAAQPVVASAVARTVPTSVASKALERESDQPVAVAIRRHGVRKSARRSLLGEGSLVGPGNAGAVLDETERAIPACDLTAVAGGPRSTMPDILALASGGPTFGSAQRETLRILTDLANYAAVQPSRPGRHSGRCRHWERSTV